MLTSRELTGRFTGSFFGRFWLFLSPLMILCIYAYFFGEILQAKWNIGDSKQGLASFALLIFSGLILHQLFSDCICRSPDLVLSNPNYVKKIVFPLEILAYVALFSSVVQMITGLIILLIAFVIMTGVFYWTWLLLPLVYIPFFLMTLGLMWILAALGVFLRDLRQIMQFVATVTLFLSPVFYPMNRLPSELQFLPFVNPLVVVIEQSRLMLFEGTLPDWGILFAYFIVSLVVVFCGHYFFTRSKPAFADVI
jgi:lipopolysaccharide transport system permease protein